MRDVPTAQLYGVDVMPLAIDLSKKTNPWCQFSLVPPLPPSNLPTGSFDLIYLHSVFSHLSELAHDHWLTEFQRLLRSGGLLFATTWPRHYIERCESARQGDVKGGTHRGSLLAFEGTEEWLARYDRGDYCHSPVGGGDVLSSDYYGETCIPEAYVRRRWANRYDVREYIEADDDWLWPVDEAPKLLTVSEAALMLRCSEDALYRKHKRLRLGFVDPLDRKLKFQEVELRAYLARQGRLAKV